MEHTVVRTIARDPEIGVFHENDLKRAVEWARSTPDGDLLDLDVFGHSDTFLLEGRTMMSPVSYMPVQRPLMLENLIFRPGLTDRERAVAMTRMTEAAISEAWRRDAGELYFLCRHPATCAFAERHLFERIDGEDSHLKLKVYRLNLRETFGA
jgi:hypothetical protein